MNYTPNYTLKLPERNEQFNLDDWNDNTSAIDTQMKANATNIATNATNIATLLTNLTTNKSNDNTSTYFKLMKLIYPVGSIYWSNNSANPSTLFGGTWTQIKDKFVWAKGDSDTVGATGGAKTVTLTVNNLPSHNHSFTPQGSVSVTTNPTFTGTAVTSGVNSRGHTHTLNNGNTSSSGTVATAGFRGVAVTSGEMSGSTSASAQAHGPNNGYFTGNGGRLSLSSQMGYTIGRDGSWQQTTYRDFSIDLSHTHSVTANGYLYGKTDGESQNHTHSVTASGTISGGAYSFSGTAGTTGNKGSGTAINIMPPYIVKYCWERTA